MSIVKKNGKMAMLLFFFLVVCGFFSPFIKFIPFNILPVYATIQTRYMTSATWNGESTYNLGLSQTSSPNSILVYSGSSPVTGYGGIKVYVILTNQTSVLVSGSSEVAIGSTSTISGNFNFQGTWVHNQIDQSGIGVEVEVYVDNNNPPTTLQATFKTENMTAFVCITNSTWTVTYYGDSTYVGHPFHVVNVNFDFGSSTYNTRIYGFEVIPATNSVTLNAPSSTTLINFEPVTFLYTPNFYEAIQNASLWLNIGTSWQSVAWNTTAVQANVTNSINYTFTTTGTYIWNVEVFNFTAGVFATNNFTLTVYPVPPPTNFTALYQWLDYFSSSSTINWSEDMDTIYLGYILGTRTLTDLQNGIAALTNWQDVLRWSARCHKYGIDNQTKIEWALDNAVMLSDGSLPSSSGGNSPSDYFSVYDREFLYGYYWAIHYNYDLSKWNVTLAYNDFRTEWVNYGTFLFYYNTTNYNVSPTRYYDECAEDLSCFLLFYELCNMSSAFAEAKTVWNYISNNYWNNTAPQHYEYLQGQNPGWECEFGGFLQIISDLQYDNGSVLANSSNLITDLQIRFLSDCWGSYQWTPTHGIPNYCVVHESTPSNPQHRLENTIMAWSAILGTFTLLSPSAQQNVTSMLSGFSGYAPAWKLLMNQTTNLYNSALSQFRFYDDAYTGPLGYSNTQTAYGMALMSLLGVIPINATIAVPIEELHYEYLYNILDEGIFSINLSARTITLGIANAGTLEFIYNTTIYQNFDQNGTYTVSFNSDWSNITSVTRIGDLPNNRKYILNSLGSPTQNQPPPAIPELEYFLMLPPFMMTTLLAVVAYQKKTFVKDWRVEIRRNLRKPNDCN